jgi:hypothetical protein
MRKGSTLSRISWRKLQAGLFKGLNAVWLFILPLPFVVAFAGLSAERWSYVFKTRTVDWASIGPTIFLLVVLAFYFVFAARWWNKDLGKAPGVVIFFLTVVNFYMLWVENPWRMH